MSKSRLNCCRRGLISPFLHCTGKIYLCSGILLVSILCTSLRTTSKSAFDYYLIPAACVPLVGSSSYLGTCNEKIAFPRSTCRGCPRRDDSLSSTSVWSVVMTAPTSSIVWTMSTFSVGAYSWQLGSPKKHVFELRVGALPLTRGDDMVYPMVCPKQLLI